MPQYTLHEERHFLNVLGIMDALVPDEVMNQLTPLECALLSPHRRYSMEVFQDPASRLTYYSKNWPLTNGGSDHAIMHSVCQR